RGPAAAGPVPPVRPVGGPAAYRAARGDGRGTQRAATGRDRYGQPAARRHFHAGEEPGHRRGPPRGAGQPGRRLRHAHQPQQRQLRRVLTVHAMWKLTATEGKLFLREPMSVLFGVLLPTAILLGLGAIPALRAPAPDFD